MIEKAKEFLRENTDYNLSPDEFDVFHISDLAKLMSDFHKQQVEAITDEMIIEKALDEYPGDYRKFAFANGAEWIKQQLLK